MTAILDTNVIVRHLTQDPPAQGRAASDFFATADSLLLTDVIVAETVYVLQSVYHASRTMIAESLRALLSLKSVAPEHGHIILRTLDLYELDRMDFADAYLVAFAETNHVPQIVSFDKGIGKASTVTRIDPGTR